MESWTGKTDHLGSAGVGTPDGDFEGGIRARRGQVIVSGTGTYGCEIEA